MSEAEIADRAARSAGLDDLALIRNGCREGHRQSGGVTRSNLLPMSPGWTHNAAGGEGGILSQSLPKPLKQRSVCRADVRRRDRPREFAPTYRGWSLRASGRRSTSCGPATRSCGWRWRKSWQQIQPLSCTTADRRAGKLSSSSNHEAPDSQARSKGLPAPGTMISNLIEAAAATGKKLGQTSINGG